MEHDNEVTGANYTTEFREYDPRICRWLSIDPAMAKYPGWSPYVFAFDNPIWMSDPNGDEPTKRDLRIIERRINKFDRKVEKEMELMGKAANLELAIGNIIEKYKDKRWMYVRTYEPTQTDGLPYKDYNIGLEYKARNLFKTTKYEPASLVLTATSSFTNGQGWEIENFKITEPETGSRIKSITIKNITQQNINTPFSIDVSVGKDANNGTILDDNLSLAKGESKIYDKNNFPSGQTYLTISNKITTVGYTNATKYSVMINYDKPIPGTQSTTSPVFGWPSKHSLRFAKQQKGW
jgi:RHS repeat-associated protein